MFKIHNISYSLSMINSSFKCGRGKFENKKEEPQELGVLGGLL